MSGMSHMICVEVLPELLDSLRFFVSACCSSIPCPRGNCCVCSSSESADVHWVILELRFVMRPPNRRGFRAFRWLGSKLQKAPQARARLAWPLHFLLHPPATAGDIAQRRRALPGQDVGRNGEFRVGNSPGSTHGFSFNTWSW